MTDQELDKECELLKRYMKYYVDVLYNNIIYKRFIKRYWSVEKVIEYYKLTGMIPSLSVADQELEHPVSFDLWKKTVQHEE